MEGRVRYYYVNNCLRRGIRFSIPKKEFSNLIQSSCHYCGSPPRNQHKLKIYLFLYQGLDRLDNSKGYISGNCVPCCRRCNSIKGEHLSHEEMILVASVLKGLTRAAAHRR